MKRTGRYWWVAGIVLALALVILSPLASPNPDGLERVAEDSGFIDEAESSPYDVMPDYALRWIGDGAASRIIAGAIGTLVVFAMAYGLTRLMRRRNRDGHAAGGDSVRESGSGE